MFSIALIYYSIRQARTGKPPSIRRIAALDAIEEAVGRCAEMGRPLHFSTGTGGLTNQWAPLTVAALSLLGHTAKLAGEKGIDMRYATTQPYLIPIAQDLIKTGYTAAGSSEMYRDDMAYFVGQDQKALMADVSGYLVREKAAANLLFGAIFWETVVIMGAGSVAGAMNIAGTPRLWYIAIILCTCDYAMIGDEIYAAAAIVEKSAANAGTIRGQDYIKIITLILVIASIVLTTIRTGLFSQIIGW
jgi:hypothetical protein